MDFIVDLLKNQFIWGLLLGLLVTFFTWKSGFSARRHMKKEVTRVQGEQKELQQHLNTQLKVNAEGNDSLQKKLEELREQNENLRVNISALQQKPGRAEIRQLQVMESAIGIMREQAPGFAQAWEQAVRQAEADHEAAEGGLKKLVKKVLPNIGTTTTTETAEIISEHSEKDSES